MSSGDQRQYKVEMTILADPLIEESDLQSAVEAAMLMRGFVIPTDGLDVREELLGWRK